MGQYLQITDADRAAGCYLRREYQNDIVLNRVYSYKELSITFSRRAAKVADRVAEEMVRLGFTTAEQNAEYLSRFSEVSTGQGVFSELSLEEIYRQITAIRLELFGAEAMERMRAHQMKKVVAFAPTAIDQRAKIEARLAECKAVIIALCEAEFYGLMQEDLRKAEGKNVYFLVSRASGQLLPTRELLPAGYRYLKTDLQEGIQYDAELQAEIDDGKACLLVYGEEGLLNCRGLRLDAAVYAIARGYQSRAVLNQMNGEPACAVFIPAGFDISKWVRITSTTRISYWHLARLWEDFGDAVYRCTPVELYQKYPQYFMDIYQSSARFHDWGIPMQPPKDMEDFDHLRDQAIKAYLDGFKNIQYHSAYFDENLEEQAICRDSSQPQPGILVQAVRVKKARMARVLACEKGQGLRQMFEKMGEKGVGVVSNFLFFLTARLANLYNTLRNDRPLEQADVAAGHLDYMLYERDGKRIETFPLFRKTCLAMKENGEFLFFNFRLGGGTLTLGETSVSWSADQVDPETLTAPVCVLTPYASLPDEEEDSSVYRRMVGEGRVNIVILQDKITCIRKGDVILPGIGVVVSLEQSLGEELLETLSLPELQDGYFDTSKLDFSVLLDAPAEIDPEIWKTVRWAYGGGLSLILDGVSLSDGDEQATEEWFRKEGWMSPLSRQTQESSLHTMVKHPRTAIGTTKDGDLVILVYSGRTWRSTGADYREMITIARTLFPDVRSLMNVDGGGSAMLGMVQDGKFMELSCPSSSSGSIVGMVRPINTVFYLPAEE